MAQTGSQEWAQGWGIVRRIHDKLEFVAFFHAQEDAEAAAAKSGIDCEVGGLTYRDRVGCRLVKDNED